METCRLCGATVMDKEELQHHTEQVHPNMVGKKGGEQEKERQERRPPTPT